MPGVYSSIVPFFLGIIFFRFFTIMAKLLEIDPMNQYIWKGKYLGMNMQMSNDL
jgi:hypothetical protein